MSVAPTILFVTQEPAPPSLLTQLEERSIFVEQSTPEDFAQTFTVVGPDLVVLAEQEPAERLVQFLQKQPSGARKIRLVLLVERAHLALMRKLDRSVVVSVLARDMPEKILLERLTLLAQKSVEQALLEKRRSELPPAILPRSPTGSSLSPSPPPTAAQSGTEPRAATPPRPPALPQPAPHQPAAPHQSAQPKPALPQPAPARPPQASFSRAPVSAGNAPRVRPLPPPRPAQKSDALAPPVPAFSAPAVESPKTHPEPAHEAQLPQKGEELALESVQPDSTQATPPSTEDSERSRDRESSEDNKELILELQEPPRPTSSPAEEELKLDPLQSEIQGEPAHEAPAPPNEPAHEAPNPFTLSTTPPPSPVDPVQLSWQTEEAPLSTRPTTPPPPTVEAPLPPFDTEPPPGIHTQVTRPPQPGLTQHTQSTVQILTGAQERIALVDEDITRADSCATALRQLGFTVHLVPPDPARTRWALLRQFQPQVFLTNSQHPPSPTWMDLLRADAHLQSVQQLAVPYGELFDDVSGSTSLAPLLKHLPLPAPPARVTTPSVLLDGPTQKEQELTWASEEVTKIADASLLSEDPLLSPPGISSRSGVALPTPSSRPERRWPLFAIAFFLVLLVVGVAVWKFRPEVFPALLSSPATAPQAPSDAQPSAPEVLNQQEAAPPDEPTGEQAQADEPPPDLWKRAETAAGPTCEELVPDTESLRLGDVAQANFYWDKARSALVLGDQASATGFLCRAILIHPSSLALEALAESYLQQGALSQAKRWIEVAVQQRPGRPKTLELQADINSQWGEPERARAQWITALGVKPTDQRTLDLVARQQVQDARAALRSGQLKRAELLLRRAASLSPSSAEAAAELVRVFLEQGELPLAERWFSEVQERAPDSVFAKTAEGDLKKQQKDWEGARASYEQALQLDPRHQAAKEQLGQLPSP